jgi:FG-GAP-like repeat
METSKAHANLTLTLCIAVWLLAGESWEVRLPLVWAQAVPQWGSPTMLEAGSGEAQYPRLAADASGTAVAVWAQQDGTYSSIWATRYVIGQSWETATLIEANPGDARGPWVAMDGNGNAVVVWSQYDDAYLSIWANRYVVGEGWGTPTLLETNPGEASETWISMDTSGNAIAVWRQTDGVDLSIWANRYVEGKGWGTPTLIEHAPGFASFPHVELDSSGNALVVWYQGPDSNSRSIWANRYTIGQGWGPPTLLENNPGNAQGPDVAIDSDGSAIAVWRQFDGVDISIWAARYVPGEGWDTPIPIETNVGEAVRPAVAMDQSGNAVAVWVQFDGTYDSVWANRYVVGEGWGSATLIEHLPGDARLPKVVIDSNRLAVAVWSQDDGTQINIWSNHERHLPTFIDVSEAAGFLRSNLQSSWAAAWADYDLDGHVDVITLGHNQQDTNSFTQLWHNNGDGTFSDVTAPASMDTRGDSHGAVWADLDNDGDLDLVIAKGTLKDKSSRNYHELWRNNNDGTFTNIAVPASVTGIGHRGRGVSAVDYNQDGKLDLFIVSERDEPSQGGNLLFQINGAMRFTDTASTAGLAREGETELFQNRTAAWADFNLDGFPDVFLAQPCALYLNKGNETFVEVSVTSGIGTMPECFSGTWGDYDNDGDLDLYISMDSDGVVGILYRNNDDETFTDVTNLSGAINPSSSRSVMWGDYDNDGYLDLYIVNENNQVNANRLFRNNGDRTFTDVTSTSGVGAQVPGGGAGGTFIDYNKDGFLDIFITNGQGNNKGPYVLLKNTTNSNNWIKVKLDGVFK